MRFLHLSDVHLEAKFTGTGMPPSLAKIRRQEVRDTFARAISLVREEQIPLLFIAGDLIEARYAKRSTVHFLSELFDGIPKTEIVLAAGNHDPFAADSLYRALPPRENLHIIGRDGEVVELPSLDTAVYAAGFSGETEDMPLTEKFQKRMGIKTHILVTHGTLGGAAGEKYHPINRARLLEQGFDYAALGHIHAPTLDDTDPIRYAGSLEPLGFDEPGEHGAILGELVDGKVKTRFLPLAKRRCETVRVDITGLSHESAVDEAVQKAVSGLSGQLVRIVLCGAREEGLELDTDVLKGRIEGPFFVRVKDETALSLDYDAMEKEQSLRGLYIRMLKERMERETDEEQRKILEEALVMGVEALRS